MGPSRQRRRPGTALGPALIVCQCLHSLHDSEMAVRTAATAALKALVVVVARYRQTSAAADLAAEDAEAVAEGTMVESEAAAAETEATAAAEGAAVAAAAAERGMTLVTEVCEYLS